MTERLWRTMVPEAEDNGLMLQTDEGQVKVNSA